MSDLLYRRYLERLGPDGAYRCSCGREHRILTREVLVGEGVIEELPALLRERYGSRVRVWLLSDQNTERAAGERCRELLGRWPLSGVVLPASPKPKPVLELSDALFRRARSDAPGLVLAVGSGVISDLGKKVAHELGVPNWCVATAPSVDAYTSRHSVFKSRARHESIPVRPSEVVFCELGVLAASPPQMALAGLGDLLGKFLACLDWNLSALITGEHLCTESLQAARDSALRALAALEDGRDPRAATLPLTDALLTTGFLMQAVGSSRPASSSEHMAAHVWELLDAVGVDELALHGLLVGLASQFVLEAYRCFYEQTPPLSPSELRGRLEALAAEPGWEQQVPPGLASFIEHIRQEMAAAEWDRDAWSRRLTAYARQRESIAELARSCLEDLAKGLAVLKACGFPFRPASYGLDPEQAHLPFPAIRLLRSRYNTFWLMHELGRQREPLQAIRALIESL